MQADGSLLLFMDRGTIALWRDGMLTEIVPEISAEQQIALQRCHCRPPRPRVLRRHVQRGIEGQALPAESGRIAFATS